jgi:phytoene dehydrogenase-like protein
LPALELCAFDPGAVICRHGQTSVLTDPLRDLPASWAAIWSNAATPFDKLRLLLLSRSLTRWSSAQLWDGPDISTLAYLRQRRFSARIIEWFFAPFYGGIFLDRSLSTSAKCFLFDLKMLAEGRTVIPSRGMGAIPQQLAEGFVAAQTTLRCNNAVVGLVHEETRVVGVRLNDGQALIADAVVLAVPAPIAQQLAGLALPSDAKGTTTLYWEGDTALTTNRKLWLNANSDTFVNNACQLSAIAPHYAPAGRHLLSASVLGVPEYSDDELYAAAEADIQRMLDYDPVAQQAFGQYRRLRIYRIPYAQFAQPPGIHPTLPANRTSQAGLYLAGEYTEASSIDAAMISGEKVAKIVHSDLTTPNH